MKYGLIEFADGVTLNSVLDGYSNPQRSTPIDIHTVVNWKFNETAAPYKNSGTAGELDLNVGNVNTPTSNIVGVLDNCIFCGENNDSFLKTVPTTVGEVVGNQITVSLWLNLRSFKIYGVILTKMYYSNNSWTDPRMSILICQRDISGQIYLALNIDGEIGYNFPNANELITFNTWNHYAITYDGTYVKSYKNGELYNTKTKVGNMDYGTHGSWYIMKDSISGNSTGYIEDVRVESVARSSEYIRNMYRRGVGLL